ncbi:class I SAM-dependent methyltransferase [Rhizohabitans arisaemae]|uniref:class I SAM-dependent methyltransferase n=1 Tax=Rhizohabitans arisaemae TaxID=2720610 RepID=UPI0024B135F3|nr:class I SAM-dependent methyltransferase [Rhizohabitans arisaemae]
MSEGGHGPAGSPLTANLSIVAKTLPAQIRRRGIARAIRLAFHELAFDLRNHTETSFDDPAGPRTTRNPPYESCNPLLFAESVARLPADPCTAAFLDLGSGKGRALILAARHGFAHVTGVEISPSLCAIARRNIAVHREHHPGDTIDVHCADAAVYELPPEINVVFLCNPFGPEIMHRVIARIRESVERSPRDLHVVYLNPRCANLFTRSGFKTVHRQNLDTLILRHTP